MSRARLSRWAFAVTVAGLGYAVLDLILRRSEKSFYERFTQ